ncbi:MAG: prepilin-type N-terminal cleavage/methylation domain-containing protein [Candidatus Doudnabacteria bacterium]|nr:prepilin-type N-terminal cleavage/methylation domain-containing protein [Candidatus Doudnabacteria bacterium]
MRTTSRNKQGFTLIEAIVATALFAFVVSSVLGVYLSILRLDTRTRALRAVTDDGRFIMDFLAKEIRNGRIAYEDYPNNLTCKTFCGATYNPTDLYLVNQNGEHERIFYFDRTAQTSETNHVCTPASNACDLYITKGSAAGQVNQCSGQTMSAGTTQLNSCNVQVTQLRIYTLPIGDPFAGITYNYQPHVVISMELTSKYNSRDQVKIELQSTFSTLYYPARP